MMDTAATTVEYSNAPAPEQQFPIDIEQDCQVEALQSDETILDSYNFQSTPDLKQEYLTNLCLTSLKNIDSLSLRSL